MEPLQERVEFAEGGGAVWIAGWDQKITIKRGGNRFGERQCTDVSLRGDLGIW